MADGRSKKVAGSLRARRAEEGVVAVARIPLRRQAPRVRGRIWVQHLHDAPESQSSERKEGLREGPSQPWQEHHPDRLDHPPRRNGRVDERRRSNGRLSLRDLCGALPGTVPLRGTGGGTRWARGAQDRYRVRELIEARGADLVLLPSYSPDLNPIEEAFSKIKQLVRKAGARVHEALVEALGRALAAVTLEDAAGWFAHAGYWPQDQPL